MRPSSPEPPEPRPALPGSRPERQPVSSWASLLALAPIAALGAILRLRGLSDQLLFGDELHAVRAAIAMRPGTILRTFGVEDYSLPLTALARLLADHGLPMSEPSLRAPSVVAGVLLLIALPLLLARFLEPRATLVFAGLCAVSPWLVLYARIARPYALALLFAHASLLLFARGWERNSRPGLYAWALGAALTVWVLPVFAPLVAAPLLLAPFAGDGSLRARVRAVVALALPALVFAAGVGLLVLRALPSLAFVWLAKTSRDEIPLAAWRGAAELLAGLGAGWPAAALGALAGGGWLLAARRHGRLAWFLCGSAALQAVAIAWLRPAGAGATDILARYLLPALPVALLGAALGIDALLPRARRPGLEGVVVGALAAAILFAGGPLPAALARPATFLYHQLRFTAPPAPAALPPAYLCPVAARAATLVEAPFPARVFTTEELYARARLHRRRVVLGTDEEITQPRLTALRTLVQATPEALLGSDGDALILHLRPDLDEARNAAARPRLRRMLDQSRAAAAALAPLLTRRWGEPDCADARHLVWDLGRVRRGAPVAAQDQ